MLPVFTNVPIKPCYHLDLRCSLPRRDHLGLANLLGREYSANLHLMMLKHFVGSFTLLGSLCWDHLDGMRLSTHFACLCPEYLTPTCPSELTLRCSLTWTGSHTRMAGITDSILQPWPLPSTGLQDIQYSPFPLMFDRYRIVPLAMNTLQLDRNIYPCK